MRANIQKMVSKFFLVLIFCSCVVVFSGCQDEGFPEITHIGKANGDVPPAVIIPPRIKPSFSYNNVPVDWIPPAHLENKKRWRGIIIHHSAVEYGCAVHEDKYHKSIGWQELGYHFVINNGVYKKGYGQPNGLVEVGDRWRGQRTGAHCRPDSGSNYYNKHTIGICLIGNFNKTRPTERQWRSLVKLVSFLQRRYNIPTNQIKGHRDIKPTDCPGRNFSFSELRRRLSMYK